MRLALLLSFAVVAEAQCPRFDFVDPHGEPVQSFGEGVAVSHPYLVVGAPRDDDHGFSAGTVLAWTYDDHSQTWVPEGEILSTVTSYGDFYGRGLDVTNEWLAVSATHDEVGQVNNAGTVTMFRRQGGAWVQHSVLSVPSPSSIQIGDFLSLSGHHLIVGSRGGGAFAWHFDPQADSWDFVQTFNTPGSFGYVQSISVAGDQCIIGNPWGYAPFGHPGAAHVYTWNGTSWSEDHFPLMTGEGPSIDGFSHRVATDGETFAVSCVSSSFSNGGPVYVFRKQPDGSINIVDRIENDLSTFGEYGLDVLGGRVVISSIMEEVSIYEWDDLLQEYVLWKKYDHSDVGLDVSDWFGFELAIDDRWLVVSASRWNTYQGRAYAWDLGACTPIGTEYCDPAVVNTTGLPGSIHAEGVPLAGGYPLSIVGSDLPNGQAALLVTSQAQGSVTPPGSVGVLCLGAPIGRFRDPEFVTGGEVRFDVDTTNMPMQPNVAIQPGETWNFQIWYRDTGVSNFTSATEVSFQ